MRALKVAMLGAALLLSGCGYNKLQTQDEGVKAAWSEVLSQYQRRADLIPNLVATVKGYAAQEEKVLIALELQAESNKVMLYTFPEAITTDEFVNKMMNDWRDVGGGNDQIWTLSGLANGRYKVFTYAATPSSLVRTTSITIWTPQYLQTKTVTNPYVFGQFAEGKTHSVHEFNVTDGTFNFRFEVSSLSQYFNGMQIVAVPEPATILIFTAGLAVATRYKGKR